MGHEFMHLYQNARLNDGNAPTFDFNNFFQLRVNPEASDRALN